MTDSLIKLEGLPNKLFLNNDIECNIQYWDIHKFNELKRSKSKRLPINIDFNESEFKNYNIKYLENKINNNLSYYLVVFPAMLIAELYSTNKTQLLENNVRVFLSSKVKANADMRKTIKDNPNNFFSYNNGISATAESVEIKDNRIIKINDFQIVNGGQTTATIDYCRRKDGASSLSNVMVAVKITSIKKDENYSKTVENISKAANTQTAVKKSDFDSNKKVLLDIERLSFKNPVLDQNGLNTYYFFERMAGQYNVTLNSQSSESIRNSWQKTHPKHFSFNKIDVARWYNTFLEKPFLAAEGAEKQFKEFIELNLQSFGINKFKTIVGFGLLFNRIKKLCGSFNGRLYPSLTKDSNTGNHAPVAMSTALYASAYLHYITNGKIDYWGIFEFKYGIAKSLMPSPNVRIDSDLDIILEVIIIECWKQIEKYGGAAAQEQTKKKLCWDFVKSNIKLDENIKNKLIAIQIPDDIANIRYSENYDTIDSAYFNSLSLFLSNKSSVIYNLFDISRKHAGYMLTKNNIQNFINRVKNADGLLTQNKVIEIQKFYDTLKAESYVFTNDFISDELIINIDFKEIYSKCFENRNKFYTSVEDIILNDEYNFEVNEKKYFIIIEIIDKYEREYGLSINDFEILMESLNYFESISQIDTYNISINKFDNIDLVEDRIDENHELINIVIPRVQDPNEKSRYSDSELKEFKEIVTKKLESANEELQLLTETLSNPNNNGTDDTAGTFKVLEDGSATLEKEHINQLAIRQRKFIEQLEAALSRIANKTYGICRETGKLIPKERLIAVPHTTLSIEAKLKQN